MTNERQREIRSAPEARLTDAELAEGWHFCNEFDLLLTQGEVMQEDDVTCLCGFDRRKFQVVGGQPSEV